uniref:Uncharacterized protein n=1 Tax=Globodera rostochiensis TaxID=31243 RepID=A0A914HT02_GLORO
MEEFCFLILVAFFVTNSLDKAESVQLEELEELPLQTFDELFVDEWWDKDEAEDLKMPAPTNFRQNVHHQIDRQNTLIEPNSTDHSGQIEPNSTDHSGQIEPNSTDHSGQIEPNSTDQLGQIEQNSTDQNPPLTNSNNAKNGKELIAEDERKRSIVGKEIDQMKAELQRNGFKNSQNELDKTVAKELGLNFTTIYAWKRELGQTTPKKYHHIKQKELMKLYYEIKGKKAKMSDEDITKMLKIGRRTLYNWKKQFKRQQLQPNSVDGHSVEENAAANV